MSSLELGARSLVHFHVAIAVVLQALLAEDLHGVLVGLRPVDNADGVVGLSVLGVERDNLLLGRLGFIEVLDVALNGGDLLERVQVVGVLGEDLVKAVHGLLCGGQVLRGVEVRHYLIAVRGGEVKLRRLVVGIQSDRVLEVTDRFLVVARLERLHAFDKLIARPQLGTANGTSEHNKQRNACNDPCAKFHERTFPFEQSRSFASPRARLVSLQLSGLAVRL